MVKQTELHRHLDVSTRLTTLLELAQREGIEGQSTSLAQFRKKIVLDRPLGDLSSVLGTFELFQKVLTCFEDFVRIGFEVVEDCYNEGTRVAELRFSPSFVCEVNGMNWLEATQGFDQGIKKALLKYPDMRAGMICIASRDYGPDAAAKTVEFALVHREYFIGLDLAGNEIGFPCSQFVEAFKPAMRAGVPVTIHAGEASGPENVWEAIDLLGAKRIGHGIRSIEDPALMKTLSEKKICLEVCPTSNWLTHATKTFETHPLPKLLRAGVPVSINTDDPAVFGCTVPGEVEHCRKKMGMNETEIQKCMSHAYAASFIKNK